MSIAEDIHDGEICQYCHGEIEDNNIQKGLGYPITCKECEKGENS
jgi:hypothetical protein